MRSNTELEEMTYNFMTSTDRRIEDLFGQFVDNHLALRDLSLHFKDFKSRESIQKYDSKIAEMENKLRVFENKYETDRYIEQDHRNCNAEIEKLKNKLQEYEEKFEMYDTKFIELSLKLDVVNETIEKVKNYSLTDKLEQCYKKIEELQTQIQSYNYNKRIEVLERNSTLIPKYDDILDRNDKKLKEILNKLDQFEKKDTALQLKAVSMKNKSEDSVCQQSQNKCLQEDHDRGDGVCSLADSFESQNKETELKNDSKQSSTIMTSIFSSVNSFLKGNK